MSAAPNVSDLPVETIIRLARATTQRAAGDAVAAARVVAGWRDGHVEDFGPGARPLASEAPVPGPRPER
ncbi:hypothetical protein U5817_13440 [Aromatoleum evansii]|uniref:Uncharacterized protein n=1 Tax=Aromatoleum evansii TaxID=59406 RepID=A0ABZ1AET5_AROEV|nr:hypothetical protein U5817_13440 [Aromatoleum evansii]